MPNNDSITTEAAYEPRAAYSPTLNTPMKIDPSGTSPISTLSPESLPASMLPAPIPSDRQVISSPTSRSLAFSAARDASGGIRVLAVIHREREEVDALAGIGIGASGGENHVIANAHDAGTVGLLR